MKKASPNVVERPRNSLYFTASKGHPLHGAAVGSRHHLGIEAEVRSVGQPYDPDADKDAHEVSLDVHGMKYHRADKVATGTMQCPQCGTRGAGPYCPKCGMHMRAMKGA